MAAKDFAGKSVLVTGAGSGIGYEVALAFAREGADIVATDIHQQGLQQLAPMIESLGRKCRMASLDVADEQAFEQLAEQLTTDDMLPDIVVNNAGIGFMHSFVNTSSDVWRRTFDVNLFGVVFGSRAFIRRWQKAGIAGHLVNVSSAASIGPMPNLAAYSASKYAVEGLCEVLAMELAGSAIAVTCVHPGIINTAIVQHNDMMSMSAQQVQRLQRHYVEQGAAPSVVANDIVDGVRKKKHCVYSGPGSTSAWVLKRLLPKSWFRALRMHEARKIGYL
jgi:NAD(P)-dependent dehydrogenase (short-subunit alcohol dehydrogenase family)